MYDNMKMKTTKTVSIFLSFLRGFKKTVMVALVIMLAFVLASCAIPVQGDPPASPGVTPANTVTLLPEITPSPTMVPTTPPDVTATPEPSTSPTEKPTQPPSTVPAGIVKDSGQIIGADVAFRKKPNSDSEVISRLSKGSFVQILKTNVNAQWHQVKYNDKTGYVNRMYICLDSSLDGYNLDFVGKIVNCNNDVNVRKEPSTDSKIIGVVKKGDKLTVVPQDSYIENWYKVKYNDEIAYIHANYLDITANVKDDQLADLSISGGSLFPSFSPNEYGYVVKAKTSEVTIRVKANSGVKVAINGSSGSTYKITIPSSGMKTVRIALDGTIKYSLYISRNVLTVGTWNIKRGNGHLLMQGRLVYDQQPDIMGIQEAFQNLKSDNIIDNLASIKTKDMSHNVLSPTLNYSKGGKYGNGMLSRYELKNVKTYPLYSGKYEKRLLQKAEIEIDGKKVSFYNTHFTYNTAEVRKKQFEQVLDIMKKDKNKYKILTGDFNAKFSEFSVLKGYTIVNTNETKYYDYSKKPIDYSEIDNIVVTKNIKVINSRLVVNSFSDHYPVFAYVVLN